VASDQPVVLVVDDEVLLLRLIETILEPEGYHVVTAVDGASAMARLAEGGIDLVLLDVMLPDVDGRELCQRIRAQPSPTYVPVIMLTALAAPTDRHAGFRAGADDYLTKPFGTEELADRVRVWVRVHRYLESHAAQRPGPATERGLLEMALATCHDLTRLLMLLLTALEEWETTQPSAEDLRCLRGQFQAAADVVASRINLLMRQARPSAGA
jgi:DNA-binding response OmpR family regulator